MYCCQKLGVKTCVGGYFQMYEGNFQRYEGQLLWGRPPPLPSESVGKATCLARLIINMYHQQEQEKNKSVRTKLLGVSDQG